MNINLVTRELKNVLKTYNEKKQTYEGCSIYNETVCSAGKCRIAGKRHNLRKMSHRRREMSQSAENVVNPTTGICRIVDGKCRKKFAACICRNIDGKCRNY